MRKEDLELADQNRNYEIKGLDFTASNTTKEEEHKSGDSMNNSPLEGE